MKKIIFKIICILSVVNSFAQVGSLYTDEVIHNIKSGTLFTVLSGNKNFDERLTKAVQDYWKLSPIKIIKAAEIEKYLGNANNYFIACVHQSPDGEMTINDPAATQIDLLIVFNGRKNKLKQCGSDIIAESSPIFWIADKKLRKNLNEGLEYVIKSFNDNIDVIVSKQFKNWDMLYAEINQNTGKLANKTLLICKDVLGGLLKEKTLGNYKYKYKLVSRDEFISAINSDNKDFCFLTENFVNSNEFKIFDVESKTLIYYGLRKGMIAWKESDIETLNQKIK